MYIQINESYFTANKRGFRSITLILSLKANMVFIRKMVAKFAKHYALKIMNSFLSGILHVLILAKVSEKFFVYNNRFYLLVVIIGE